jgi:hypothetical protein
MQASTIAPADDCFGPGSGSELGWRSGNYRLPQCWEISVSPEPPHLSQFATRTDANERLDRVVDALVGKDDPPTTRLPTPQILLPDESDLAVPLVRRDLVEKLDAMNRGQMLAQGFAFAFATVVTTMIVNVLTSNTRPSSISTTAWVVFAVVVTLTCCATGLAVREAVRARTVRRELLGRGHAGR